MLFNSVYFRLKPFIPRAVRMSIRSWCVRRRLPRVRTIWPIMPGSERAPDGWPGWPKQKKFAFVLTHDVESAVGVDHVNAVASLETEMGFRSSFNFVPEGPYSVPRALRSWLVARGFEVGVHDLHHDGHLFASRAEFSRRARRINEILREWGAVGFRSGYMLGNLEWIKELDISYDASTFDTDPFEPQPDGVDTIFPFWTSFKGDGQGYIELPYTMVQDSTLFLLLRERGIDLWKRKLDWIARHGGMVLLNVHPDYIDFADGNEALRYPVARYRELLEYVGKCYGDLAWNALPRDVAAYCAAFRPRHPYQTHACASHPKENAEMQSRWLMLSSLLWAKECR
jgi:hypothetical protein